MTVNQIRVAVITKTTLSDLILALMILLTKSLCVQLRTSALNVTLPALRALSSKPADCHCCCRSMDRQTDGHSTVSIDPAPHTTHAGSVNDYTQGGFGAGTSRSISVRLGYPCQELWGRAGDGGQRCGMGWGWGQEPQGRLGWGQVLVSMQLSNRSRCNRPTCIEEIEASMDMDISMDIHVKSVDMDMD